MSVSGDSSSGASVRSPSPEAEAVSENGSIIDEAKDVRNGEGDDSDKESEHEEARKSEKDEVNDEEKQSIGEENGGEEEPQEDEAKESKRKLEEDDEAGPSKRRRVVMSSDDEDDGATSPKGKGSESGDEQQGEVGVGELMTNIFGEESDEDREQQDEMHHQSRLHDEDDDEPRYIREEDDEEDDGRVWDFDEMLRSKKAERKKQRRRRKDGSIDIGNDADEQIRMLTDAMKAAAKDDRHSNMERKPALQKRKMLRYVKAMLIKHDLMEAIIDNGMLSAVSEWLAPLPDKSLPALEIRTDLLKILQDYSRLEQGTLKQSGLGRAVMLLYKHPKETKENKALAHSLISEWARPIFQLDTDFRSMSREERMQRDYSQLPESKRLHLGQHEATEVEKEPEPRVGDKGFIIRARVPRPSKKDYVIRPKSNVEGQFRGATKNRHNSRFDKTQRDFKERTKKSRAQRAIGVSIEGRKMDI
ncbi:IWS1-like protein [Toxocara canis]|uniref:IWS1-like protein n=1 Tax=Toxocara canis TaxID=6265 RepID=A0A0B2VET9_TOXCA|nr:IWS1-like protein [Toxocara canis]